MLMLPACTTAISTWRSCSFIRRPMRSLSCISPSIAIPIWKYQEIALYAHRFTSYFHRPWSSPTRPLFSEHRAARGRRDAHHRARHRPAVRAPGAGQLLLADRARQRRQVHHGLRLGLAGEFHRARNSAPGHHGVFCHPSARRPRRRLRAGVGRQLDRRPGQAAAPLRAIGLRAQIWHRALRAPADGIIGVGHATRAWGASRRRRGGRSPRVRFHGRPAWSTTATGSSSKAFLRFTSTMVRSATGSNGTGSPSCFQATRRRASSLSTMRRAPTC